MFHVTFSFSPGRRFRTLLVLGAGVLIACGEAEAQHNHGAPEAPKAESGGKPGDFDVAIEGLKTELVAIEQSIAADNLEAIPRQAETIRLAADGLPALSGAFDESRRSAILKISKELSATSVELSNAAVRRSKEEASARVGRMRSFVWTLKGTKSEQAPPDRAPAKSDHEAAIEKEGSDHGEHASAAAMEMGMEGFAKGGHAHAGGSPCKVWTIHPALVHFPIALLLVGLVIDFVGKWRPREFLSRSAAGLYVVGVAGGLLAAVSGIAAVFTAPRLADPGPMVWQHPVAAVSSIVLFAVVAIFRWSRRLQPSSVPLLAVAATAAVLLLTAGWLGHDLVYSHGFGVTPESHGGNHDDKKSPGPDSKPGSGPHAGHSSSK